MPLKTGSTWVSKYRQLGLVGLARKHRFDKGVRRTCTIETKELIEGVHLQKPHLSYASIYRQIQKIAANNKKTTPSYETVCSILNQIPKSLLTLAHKGKQAYKQKHDLLYIRESTAPNEIWQADHAMLDILILDEKNTEGKRPWLTIVIDDYSRVIAGYELSFSAPSAMKTSLALRQSIWHKKEHNWSVCGIPSIFYTDHGSDFTSKHIEQVCCDLKIQLIFSTIGEPRGRGKIERFFLTLNQMLLSELEGYTGATNAKPTLSLSALADLIHSFIMNYNQKPHSSTGQPPKLRWEANGFLPQMPQSLEKLDLLLMTVAKSRTIQRDGIRFQGLRYLDPVLADYVGVSVIIRYDPYDLTNIRVFHKGEYLCQPICHSLDQQSVSLKDIQAARITRQKSVQAEMSKRLSLVDAILVQSKSLEKQRPQAKQKKVKKSKLKLYDHED